MSSKRTIEKTFPYKCPLRQNQFVDKKKSGPIFGYVQCDIKFSEQLREMFDSFPASFKNTKVCRQDFGPVLQKYAAKNC